LSGHDFEKRVRKERSHNNSHTTTMLSAKLTTKRKPSTRKRAASHVPPFYPSQESHDNALAAIRSFLKCHTAYDAFPVSFRLIVLDTKLNVKKALQCLLLNGMLFSIYQLIHLQILGAGVVSAPLWNSEKSKFAGMLTVLDIIHLIQYYYRTASYDYAAADVETFRLESLRGDFVKQLPQPPLASLSISEIEKELGVAQPPLLSDHPSSTLYDAAMLLIQTHARRLPLLDNDSETGHEVIVSVLTQYRLLKFISINVGSASLLFIVLQILTNMLIIVSQRNSRSSSISPKTQDWHICHLSSPSSP